MDLFSCVSGVWKCEGVIKEILKKSFWVDLYLIDDICPEAEAEIPIKLIPKKDRKLIEIGNSFDWNIYEGGKSEFMFHIPPILTSEMMKELQEKVSIKTRKISSKV